MTDQEEPTEERGSGVKCGRMRSQYPGEKGSAFQVVHLCHIQAVTCTLSPAKGTGPSWPRLAHRLMEAGISLDTLALANPWVCLPCCSCPQLYAAHQSGKQPGFLMCLLLDLDLCSLPASGLTWIPVCPTPRARYSRPCIGHSQATDHPESWCSLCLAPDTASVWKLLL